MKKIINMKCSNFKRMIKIYFNDHTNQYLNYSEIEKIIDEEKQNGNNN